jgi:hypothetical protein
MHLIKVHLYGSLTKNNVNNNLANSSNEKYEKYLITYIPSIHHTIKQFITYFLTTININDYE